MSDDRVFDTELARLLFVGKITRTFHVLDQQVKMNSLSAETVAQIYRQVSGLDVQARDRVLTLLFVTHSMESIGGYAFKDFDEKRVFVGKLSVLVLDMFLKHYMAIRDAEEKAVKNLEDDLKKSAADQSPAGSGESSSDSQVS